MDGDATARLLWHSMLVRRLQDQLDSTARRELQPLLAPPAAALAEVLKAFRASDTAPTAALDALEARLEGEDRRIFVGYDELDTLAGTTGR